jgi:hypothetical protein
MIYLGNLEQIKDNKYKVNFVHYKPGLLQDTSNGILIDRLPDPTQQDGKVAVLYVNIDTKEPLYEYEDIPQTEEDEIGILKKQVADLTFMIMQMQGGNQ